MVIPGVLAVNLWEEASGLDPEAVHEWRFVELLNIIVVTERCMRIRSQIGELGFTYWCVIMRYETTGVDPRPRVVIRGG